MRTLQEDGHSTRDHLQALVRAGRKRPEELDGPQFPDEIGYLWDWFGELDRTRDLGPHGPRALSYMEVDAWARLTGRSPMPHEVDALMVLDGAMRAPGNPETED